MTGGRVQLAVTVIGRDRPGIIADTTRLLAGLGANLEDSTMSILRGHFAMVLLAAADVTAAEAEAAGIDARAVEVPTDGSPGASFQGKGTGGRSRLVVDQAKGTIVGATFTGFETADFLHAATVAIVSQAPLAQLRHAVAAYPTRSEVWLKLLEAAGL